MARLVAAACWLMAKVAASEASLPGSDVAALLCYNVRWRTSAGVDQHRKFNAITHFPISHPKVADPSSGSANATATVNASSVLEDGDVNHYCGTVPPFTRVPAFSRWPSTNQTTGDVIECQNVSGAVAYYAYGLPRGLSANTGQYMLAATSIYVIVDETATVYMIITSDMPERSGSTLHTVAVSLRGVNLDGAGVDILLRDDDADSYTWDSGTASGGFRWWWGSCCTDGVLIGPLPTVNYSMVFEFDTAASAMVGIDTVDVWSFNATTGDVDRIEFSTHADGAAVSASGVLILEVQAVGCDTYCHTFQGCDECLRHADECTFVQQSGICTGRLVHRNNTSGVPVVEEFSGSEWRECAPRPAIPAPPLSPPCPWPSPTTPVPSPPPPKRLPPSPLSPSFPPSFLPSPSLPPPHHLPPPPPHHLPQPSPVIYWVGLSSPAPLFLDIDADGDNDLVVGLSGGVLRIYENVNGSLLVGRSETLALSTNASDSAPAAVDFDGDGQPELLAVGGADGSLTSAQLVNGSFSLIPSEETPLEGTVVIGSSAPAFADFDGDGLVDLLLGQSDGRLLFVHNRGNHSMPSFPGSGCWVSASPGVVDCASGSTHLITGNGWSSPAAADLDGDGDGDIIVGGADGSLRYLENLGAAGNELLPSFFERSGTSGVLAGIDLLNLGFYVSYTHPSLFDADGDGDFDLLIGTSMNVLLYYENVGDTSTPRFVAVVPPPLGLATLLQWEPVRLQLSFNGDFSALNEAFEEAFSGAFAGAVSDGVGLAGAGLGVQVLFFSPGSVVVTFELFDEAPQRRNESGRPTPLSKATELACLLGLASGNGNAGAVMRATLTAAAPAMVLDSEAVLQRVLVAGAQTGVECNLLPPRPPPGLAPPSPSPTPALPLTMNAASLSSSDSSSLPTGTLVAFIVALLLVCCCCCLLCTAWKTTKGLSGLSLQVSRKNEDPAVLQRQSEGSGRCGRAVAYCKSRQVEPTGTDSMESSTEMAQSAPACFVVDLRKKRAADVIGLKLADDSPERASERASTRSRQVTQRLSSTRDGVNSPSATEGKPLWHASASPSESGAFLWNGASRLVALAEVRMELAPRIVAINPNGLAARIQQLSVGDAILTADGVGVDHSSFCHNRSHRMTAEELTHALLNAVGVVKLTISRQSGAVPIESPALLPPLAVSRKASKRSGRRSSRDVTWWESVECSSSGSAMPTPLPNEARRYE